MQSANWRRRSWFSARIYLSTRQNCVYFFFRFRNNGIHWKLWLWMMCCHFRIIVVLVRMCLCVCAHITNYDITELIFICTVWCLCMWIYGGYIYICIYIYMNNKIGKYNGPRKIWCNILDFEYLCVYMGCVNCFFW